MSYTATIDAGACSAHGDCEAIAPEVFRLDDVAVVIGSGDTDIDGIFADGRRLPVFRKGEWA